MVVAMATNFPAHYIVVGVGLQLCVSVSRVPMLRIPAFTNRLRRITLCLRQEERLDVYQDQAKLSG